MRGRSAVRVARSSTLDSTTAGDPSGRLRPEDGDAGDDPHAQSGVHGPVEVGQQESHLGGLRCRRRLHREDFLVEGHRQHVLGEIGFYDLRLLTHENRDCRLVLPALVPDQALDG